MSQYLYLNVTEIQRFCMHDGPGVRTTVFLKGCPLRCRWCHNPETQQYSQEILYYEKNCISCGACVKVCTTGAHKLVQTSDQKTTCVNHIFDRSKCLPCKESAPLCSVVCPTLALKPALTQMTIPDILHIVERDRAFYGKTGGITVSGGEPLFQPEATLSLLENCKKAGIHTAVETCGFFSPEYLHRLSETADLLLWDLKDTDPARHKEYTGVSNEQILENLIKADALGCHIILRCILVNGVNTCLSHYENIANIFHRLSNCKEVNLLPYHAYSGSKMLPLGMNDNGKKEWIPTNEQINSAREFLKKHGVTVH